MVASRGADRVKHSHPPLIARLVGVETRYQARFALWGYLFALPWVIGLLVFTVGPVIVSFYLSFTQYDVLSPPQWIGLSNYEEAFFKDELFYSSILRTLTYCIVSVPLGLMGSLLLAMLLNRPARGVGVFRTFFFLPSLTPVVALTMLWIWLFDPNFGLINQGLEAVGLPALGWFASPDWALPAIVITGLWAGWGGSTMLIFLAGLQGVDRSLLDAADIDGANSWTKFWRVTLPMISPTIIFNFILGVIGAMQVFTVAYVATEGGPRYATWFFALHIYNHAFRYFQMGYGSALAWLFLAALLVFTVIQLRLSRSWVYYGGESK